MIGAVTGLWPLRVLSLLRNVPWGPPSHSVPSPLSTLARMAPLPFSVKGGHRCPRPPLLANSVAHRFDSVLVDVHGNFAALELCYPFFDHCSSGPGYLLPSQAVCLFLSLLPLTWIDYSMNSAIILAQSCIRDPRPLRWFVFTYILGFNTVLPWSQRREYGFGTL